MRNSGFAQLMSARTNTGGHRQLSHVELPALCEQRFQERAPGFLFSGWIFQVVSSESAVSAYENRERERLANSACTIELCHGPEQASRPWTVGLWVSTMGPISLCSYLEYPWRTSVWVKKYRIYNQTKFLLSCLF